MSATIDERVVEMRFDNKQFEAATKQSMSTIEKLKMKLNGLDSAKAFEGLSKTSSNIQLLGISKSLEALEQRFSGMGIVGMRVIQNLTDAVMNKLGSAFDFVKDRILEGGLSRATNIEDAHFQLQALLKDEERVQAVMDNASASVDGTAYAFDEAARAASQFAASGVEAGDQMMGALNGIVGVAAMTNSAYSDISNIFTTVAGNGRLMGDQLLQLSGRGLNAASTIAEYMNKVQDGSYQASDSLKTLINQITKGQQVTEAMVRESVTKGMISFDLFADAMDKSFSEAAGNANKTFSGAFSNLKSAFARIGQGFFSPLIEQESEVIELLNALREKVNEVKKVLVFDESLGNVTALSNVFTTIVLALAEFTKMKVKAADLTKPFQLASTAGRAFIATLDVLISYLAPLGDTFLRTMLAFSMDDVIAATEKYIAVMEKLKPSEKTIKNLKDGFQGLLSVVRLGINLFKKFLSALLPIDRETSGLGESAAALFGAFGRLLSSITGLAETSPRVESSFKGIGKIFTAIGSLAGKAANGFSKFIDSIRESQSASRFFKALSGAITGAFKIISPYAEGFVDIVKTMFEALKTVIPDKAFQLFDTFTGWLEKLTTGFEKVDVEKTTKDVKEFTGEVDTLFASVKKGEGAMSFFANMAAYVERIATGQSAFANSPLLKIIHLLLTGNGAGGPLTGGIFGKINKETNTTTGILNKFTAFVKGQVIPAINGLFNETTIGGLLSAGTGIGMMVALQKMAESFQSIGKTITSIPKSITGVLGELQRTLFVYQTKLKAESLKDVATAIAILSGSIILLSFVDPPRLLAAAGAVAAVGTVLIGGMAILEKVKGSMSRVEVAFATLAKGLKTKMISSALKDLAKSLGIIVAALAGIYLMYKDDPQTLEKATEFVAKIAGVLVGLYAAMNILGTVFKRGGTTMFKMGSAILELGAALGIIVMAIKTLFKLELPDDADEKLDIVKRMLIWIGALSVVASIGAKIGGGNKLSAGGILAMAGALYMIVSAVEGLFKMDLPNQKQITIRMNILKTILVSLGGLIIALGVAGKLSGGGVHATGTLVALCATLITVVAVLGLMTHMDMKKLYVATNQLCKILLALGLSMVGVSKVAHKASGPAVLAMAIMVASIAGSLGILSLIPVKKLVAGATALGAVLLTLSVSFAQAAKMQDRNVDKAIQSMIAIVISLAASLFVLAFHPWEKLIAASAALSTVLLAFAGALKIMSTAQMNEKQMNEYLKGIGILAAVAVAVGVLAFQPWENLLAAGASLSTVLLAFAAAFRIMSNAEFDMSAMNVFLSAAAILAPITIALGILATQPWDSLLAAGSSLSATLLAFTVCFSIISKCKVDMKAITQFLLASAAVAGIGITLKFMAKENWQALLAAGASLSTVLLALTAAMGIAALVGTVAPAAISGMLLLDAFVANLAIVLVALGALLSNNTAMALLNGGAAVLELLGQGLGRFIGGIIGGIAAGILNSLPNMGLKLSQFMTNLGPFIAGLKMIKPEDGDKAKALASTLLTMTAADILNGIASFFGLTGSLPDMATELSKFMTNLSPFIDELSAVKPEHLIAAKSLAQMMIAFTAGDILKGIGEALGLGSGQSLADFGEELAEFGPYIAEFAASVEGISASSVQGAADAAEIMSKVEANLPKHEGLVQKILGEGTTLAQFGEELVAFGPNIAKFATQVEGIKKSSVQGAADAAEIMSKLANGLPDEDRWLDKIFGGTTTIDEFGEQLVSFGASLQSYAKSVEGISASKLNDITTAISNLVDLADGMTQVNFSGVTSLGYSLSLAAQNGLKEFYDVFSSVNDQNVIDQINLMLSRVSLALSASPGVSLGTAGLNSAKSFLEAMNTAISQGFVGVKIKMIANGAYMVSGLVKGIKDNSYQVSDAMAAVASAADKALKNKLQIHSPSKVTEKSGKYTVEGLVKGVKKNTKKAADVAWDLGDDVGNSVNDGLKGANVGETISSTIGQAWDFVKDKLSATTLEKDAKKATETQAKGINSGTNAVTKAVDSSQKKVAKKAKKAVTATAKIMQVAAKEMISSQGMPLADYITKMSKNTLTATDKVFLTTYKAQKKILDQLNGDIDTGTADMTDNIIEKFDIISEAITKKAAEVARLREKQQKQEEKLQNEIDKKQQAYDAAKQAYQNKLDEKKKEKTKKQLKDEMLAAKESLRIAKEQQKAQEAIYEQNLSKEDKYWNDMLKKKKKGIDASQYADMTLHEFQMEILTKSTELMKQYTDQLEQTRDSLMNSIDIFSYAVDESVSSLIEARDSVLSGLDWFSAVEEIEPVSKEDLLSYAEDQVNILARYYEAYDSLMSKLTGTALGDYVATLGVDSIAHMEAMLDMTDEELAEYIENYEYRLENGMVIANRQALETTEKVSAQMLQDNLESQLKKNEEYRTSMEALLKRTGDSNLSDFIRTLGVDNQAEINAMLNMTDEELAEYMATYEKMLKSSEGVAKIQLQDLQAEVEKGLQDIFGTKKKIDLFDFSKAYDGTMESINKYLKQIKKGKAKERLQKGTQELTKQIKDGVKMSFEAVEPTAKDAGKEIAENAVSGIKTVMKKHKTTMADQVEDYIEEAEEKKDDAKKTGSVIADNLVEGLESIDSECYTAGANAGNGFIDGVISRLEDAYKAGQKLAGEVVLGTTDALEIHSPSKVFFNVGTMGGQGFILGLGSVLNEAGATGAALGTTAVEATKSTWNGISKVITDDMIKINPKITPQVDLSAVEAAVASIGGMFAGVSANISVGAISSGIQDTGRVTTGALHTAMNTRPNITNNNNYNFTQNNTSPKALTTSDIYRNTHNQFTALKGALAR